MKITKSKLKEIIREELASLTEAKTELSKSEKSAYQKKDQLPTWYILIKMQKAKTLPPKPFDWNLHIGSVGVDYISKKKTWTEDRFVKIMPAWIPRGDAQDIFDCYLDGSSLKDPQIQSVDQMWKRG